MSQGAVARVTLNRNRRGQLRTGRTRERFHDTETQRSTAKTRGRPKRDSLRDARAVHDPHGDRRDRPQARTADLS